MRSYPLAAALIATAIFTGALHAQFQSPLTHRFFNVQLDPAASAQPTSGRLLLFAIEAKTAQAQAMKDSAGKSATVDAVDANPFRATQTTVAAREVTRWTPGQAIDIDADQQVFPAAYSQLPPGDYYVQAVLDTDHSYNYLGRGVGDLVSAVVKLHLPTADIPSLRLVKALPAADPWQLPATATAQKRAAMATMRSHANLVNFSSPALSAFWGRPITMFGWVLTPPGYDAKSAVRYPTVYYTQGFGGNNERVIGPMSTVYKAMEKRQMPRAARLPAQNNTRVS